MTRPPSRCSCADCSTGAAIGVPQAILLRGVLPTPVIWAAVVTVGWAVAWAVTAAFGIDLARKWAVFGSSGALVFQLATGLTLAYLLGQAARPSGTENGHEHEARARRGG